MKTKKHSINKCLLVIFFTIAICQSINAQKLLWANTSANAEASGQQIIADDSGNSVVLGFFSDSIQFKKGLMLKVGPNGGYNPQYIASYDKNGICRWAFTMGIQDSNLTNAIYMNKGADGDFYISGTSERHVNINGVYSPDTFPGNYVAKLDRNGKVKWIKGSIFSAIFSTDSKGNLYFPGELSNGDIDMFGIRVYPLKNKSGIVVLKMDSSCKPVSGPKVVVTYNYPQNSSPDFYVYFNGLGEDKYGNYYAGILVKKRTNNSISDTFWVDTQEYPMSATSFSEYVAVRLDTGLHVVRQAQLFNPGSPSMDGHGNVYMTAEIDTTFQMGTNTYNKGIYLLKYDRDFYTQWAVSCTDTNSFYVTTPGALAVDNNGRSFVLRHSFDKKGIKGNLYSIEEFDAFGNWMWEDTILTTAVSPEQEVGIHDFFAGDNGDLYFTGAYDTLSTFRMLNLPAKSKYCCPLTGALGNRDTTITYISPSPQSTFNCSLFPNPANDILNIRMVSTKTESYTYSIQSMEGKEIGAGKFSAGQGSNNFALPIQSIAKGMYILTLQNNDGSQRMKFLKE